MNHKSQRILIVDDDCDNAKLMARTLDFSGYEVRVTDCGENGVELIQSWHPDLVLLDINMPGMSGLQTLRHIRQKEEYIAVIFVTAQSRSEDVVLGLDSGADDYVCKPFDATVLLARVRAQLRIKELQDQLKAANRKLLDLVDIDDLTGLYNMRSVYTKLDHELDRAKRYGTLLAVVMMDMDNFKKVNDGHDHLFGSFVLSEVGQIIKNNIRTVDFAARYGGDEFLIVLTHTQPEGAAKFAQRLIDKIAQHTFTSDKDTERLTASLGLAVASHSNIDQDSRGIVRLADNALYKAKANGKNQVVVVDVSAQESNVIEFKKAQ